MAQQRLSVRKVREILRLRFESGFSRRQIARSVGCSRDAVAECLRRSAAAGLGWPLPEGLDEAALEAQLYPPPTPGRRYPLPDFAALHAELAHKGVTRWLLWAEYKAAHPDGLQYTAFCNRYRHWLATRDVVLRQVHAPGEKLFVDYAGPTVPVIDRHTGEEQAAQIFVAVLGCSNYTFAEATWTQALPDWLGSHVRALEFIGSVPRAIVPDNLRSAVSRAHRYEPDLNPAYQDFAEHYRVAILPARVRKPRDKAKVEGGVLIVERSILARLRHQTFFSLGELNAEIAKLLTALNRHPFKKLEGCRRSRFEELERPALRPLPARPYEFARWNQAKVHPDYHIEVEHAYYSVPFKLIHAHVDVRLTEATVEVFHKGHLVTAHARAHRRGEFVTLAAHRPAAHQAVIEQSHARLLERAVVIGPATADLIRLQTTLKRHPEQTLRTSQGILRLAQDFSAEQLEAACERALEKLFGLAAGLEQQLAAPDTQRMNFEKRLGLLLQHEVAARANVRFTQRLRWAKLPQLASLEDLDTRTPRGLDPAVLAQVTDLAWIPQSLNVLITGPCEVGKSWLGCALAHAACRADYSVRCFRLPRLVDELTRVSALQKRSGFFRSLAKADLILIDDFGLAQLSDQTKRDLLEILDDRYNKKSTLVTSQLPIDQWHTYINDPTLADAILDRLVHNAYRLNLKGESMRKRKAALPAQSSKAA